MRLGPKLLALALAGALLLGGCTSPTQEQSSAPPVSPTATAGSWAMSQIMVSPPRRKAKAVPPTTSADSKSPPRPAKSRRRRSFSAVTAKAARAITPRERSPRRRESFRTTR